MKYEKHIFILFILKNYFGDHSPSKLIIMIMKFYHRDEWIETRFDKFLKFGDGAYTNISNLGAGIDQIIFKFILPELPKGVTYKKFCAYDLISNIKLFVNGYGILDICLRAFQFFGCAGDDDLTVSYRLDLEHFFGESSSGNQLLPTNFKGIRLVDFRNSDIRLYLKLHDISHIIDKENILLELELLRTIVSCHYVEVYQNNPYLIVSNKIHPIQKIRIWNTFVELIDPNCSYHEFFLYYSDRSTSKIIFYSKMLYKIKDIVLRSNGRNYVSKNNLDMYENNVVVFDVDMPSNIERVTCHLWLYENLDCFKIKYTYDVNLYGMYRDNGFSLLDGYDINV